MNGQAKFPRNQGRPIAVGRARAEQQRWKKNPNNGGLPDTFPVSVKLILGNITDPECSGIQFCNGLDNEGGYHPVMGAVDGNGNALSAFDANSEISLDEYKQYRTNWKEAHKNNKNVIQFFFLGEESLRINIEDFDVTSYEACFVEKANGKDSAVLFGYSAGGMKDPLDDPDTALNLVKLCPPECDED